MKILLKILLVILGIVALALIVALFVPKDYAVEKEVTIARPKQMVWDYVKYVKNQDNFSVWNMKDPQMKKDYTGTDGSVGFVYKWESTNKEVGKGEQEIVKVAEGDRVDMILRFKEPMEVEDNAYLSTTMVDSNTTKVKWGFYGKMPYPFNLMGLFVSMDKMVGPDLQQGLGNLKTLLEKQ